MSIQAKLQAFFARTGVAPWGLSGGLIILGSFLVAGIAFNSAPGKTYSILNRFVSELGWLAESPLSIVFNVGLIMGGFVLVVFMIGLGVLESSHWSWLGAAVGVFAAISCSFVGFFPMDTLEAHFIAAMGFFYGGMIAVGLFTIAILTQKEQKIPKWNAIPAIIVFILFIAFNFGLPSEGNLDFNILAAPETRPDFWLLPFMEWLVILGINAWILITALLIQFSNLKIQVQSPET